MDWFFMFSVFSFLPTGIKHYSESAGIPVNWDKAEIGGRVAYQMAVVFGIVPTIKSPESLYPVPREYNVLRSRARFSPMNYHFRFYQVLS
jgi:hypothetical protein